jgi:hypothetical protein
MPPVIRVSPPVIPEDPDPAREDGGPIRLFSNEVANGFTDEPNDVGGRVKELISASN